MRENGLKLCQGRSGLDIRNNLLTGSVVKHWKTLPKEVVESQSLEVFRRCVDDVLRNMFRCGLGSVRLRVGLDDFKALFKPKLFYDSII